jgi:hypothetical protein
MVRLSLQSASRNMNISSLFIFSRTRQFLQFSIAGAVFFFGTRKETGAIIMTNSEEKNNLPHILPFHDGKPDLSFILKTPYPLMMSALDKSTGKCTVAK